MDRSSINARVLSFEKSPVVLTPGSGGNMTPSRPADDPPALVGKQSFRRASASKSSWHTQLRVLQEQVKHAESKLQQSQEQLFEERCKDEMLKLKTLKKISWSKRKKISCSKHRLLEVVALD